MEDPLEREVEYPRDLLRSRPTLARFADELGKTGLHWAAINGHRDTVRLLLDRGADVTILDAHFQATPGDWANEGGHPDIANALNTQKG